MIQPKTFPPVKNAEITEAKKPTIITETAPVNARSSGGPKWNTRNNPARNIAKLDAKKTSIFLNEAHHDVMSRLIYESFPAKGRQRLTTFIGPLKGTEGLA